MKLKKEITFIYSDSAEKNNYMPIAEEAKARGYQVEFTENKFKKCEIGFYCQHINYPQFSRFSVILLHDIIQGYSRWPDLWFEEPWNKYDIGILPSKQWEDNWYKCSQWYYTRPRKGIFRVGWPKADVIIKLKNNSAKEKFYEEHGLDKTKKTIVYAPAWENDNKQDDFVQSMLKLDVNILVKQAKWSEAYSQIIQNIKDMYYLHKDNPRVTILPPETNIFEAIAVSDVLVSEESSTMCEAIMMGIPAISVSDWLIPDVSPSRYPKCDYDFVITTTKDRLTDCVNMILRQYSKYSRQSLNFRDMTFSNIGNTSSMIMDIIDDCVNENPIRYQNLVANKNQKIPFKKNIRRLLLICIREVSGNYAVRYNLIKFLWNIVMQVKKITGFHLQH